MKTIDNPDRLGLNEPTTAAFGAFRAKQLPDGRLQMILYQKDATQLDYGIEWFYIIRTPSGIGVNIFEQAQLEKPLTQTEYRVRDWIVSHMENDNLAIVNQSQMARELRIAPCNANKAIKRLVDLKIISLFDRAGHTGVYKVNPAFCYRGALGKGCQERNAVVPREYYAEIKRTTRKGKTGGRRGRPPKRKEYEPVQEDQQPPCA